MPRFLLIATLAFLALSINAQNPPECKDDNPTRNCCGVLTLAACPLQGCGGDPLLNTKKNRTDVPTDTSVEEKTFTQLTAFKRPKKWKSGTARALLETWGEGRAVQIKGYIFEAENYTSGAESTNCYLSSNDFNDFHIVIVEDLVLANKALAADEAIDTATTAAKKKAAEKKAKAAHKRAEKRSLTAEITPRLRPDGWTIAKLRKLVREGGVPSDDAAPATAAVKLPFAYVRVTGWAMLDTQHISKPIDRRSNWELHPVTKFEVCTSTIAICNTGQGWTSLEMIGD
ncbi:MAG: hypothetical protein ABL959_12745 [Pyrinomonadaceae bacterium]